VGSEGIEIDLATYCHPEINILLSHIVIFLVSIAFSFGHFKPRLLKPSAAMRSVIESEGTKMALGIPHTTFVCGKCIAEPHRRSFSSLYVEI